MSGNFNEKWRDPREECYEFVRWWNPSGHDDTHGSYGGHPHAWRMHIGRDGNKVWMGVNVITAYNTECYRAEFRNRASAKEVAYRPKVIEYRPAIALTEGEYPS